MTSTQLPLPTDTERLVLVDAPCGELVLTARRRRDGLLARLLATRLDDRLADGVAPESDRVLAVRAMQLVGPAQRRSLADAWDALLDRATCPSGLIDPRVPVARGVVGAAGEIAELTRLLRGHEPLAVRGLARAGALLTRASSPVYTGGADVRATVARLVAELRGCPVR